MKAKTMLPKLAIAFSAVAIFATLSGCGGNKFIKKEDLYGTWYSQDVSFKQTITFSQDASYETLSFVPSGSFQINKKTGEVKLVTSNRDVITLVPEKNGDDWELFYTETAYTTVVFSMNEPEYEKDASIEENPYAQVNAGRRRYIMDAVAQYLKKGEWTTDDGQPVEITTEHFKIGDGEPVEYSYLDANSTESGVFAFSFENANGTYLGQISINCDDWTVGDIDGYHLSITLNGETILKAACSNDIEIEQLD